MANTNYEEEHPKKAFGWAARDSSGVLSPFHFSRRSLHLLFFFLIFSFQKEKPFFFLLRFLYFLIILLFFLNIFNSTIRLVIENLRCRVSNKEKNKKKKKLTCILYTYTHPYIYIYWLKPLFVSHEKCIYAYIFFK